MFNLMRRLLVWGMLAVALSACSPPDRTDLLSLPIPGVKFFPFRDESSVPLMETVVELAESFVKRGAKRGINTPRLAADATTTDENIARSVDELLGPGWKRSEGFDSSRPHIHVMVWETTGWHKRFYALAAWDEVSVSTEGRPYRPIQSVFSRH
jgi:lipoprotein